MKRSLAAGLACVASLCMLAVRGPRAASETGEVSVSVEHPSFSRRMSWSRVVARQAAIPGGAGPGLTCRCSPGGGLPRFRSALRSSGPPRLTG